VPAPPAWAALTAAVRAVVVLGDHAAYCVRGSAGGSAAAGSEAAEAAAATRTTAATAECEAVMKALLMWAQTVKAAADAAQLAGATEAQKDASKPEGAEEEEEEEEEEGGTIQTWTAAVEAHVAAKRLSVVTDAVDSVLTAVASAGANGGGGAEAAAAATLATPVAMAAAALRRVLADYVRLAKAQAKLTLVLLGLFVGLYKEGFCRPPEEQEGEGQGGGKLSDDVEGTGLAEGEGKKDVSDEIENEDQLGTDPDPNPNPNPNSQP